MNFLLNRQKSRCHVLPMPDGLEELMADVSREVLRCQPSMDCIYKFIADYLEAMLKTRDKSKIVMEVIDDAILKTDEVYEQFVKCRIPKEKTTSFLDLMEITFRRFVEQKRKLHQDPRYITFHADDLLDELIRKCDLTKVEILRSRPAIQWAYKKFIETYLGAVEGTLDTEGLYMDSEKLVLSNKELENLNDAAITIQCAYRGYRARKQLRIQAVGESQIAEPELEEVVEAEPTTEAGLTEEELGQVREKNSLELLVEANDEELTKAAVVIQATYKGFAARKKLQFGEVGVEEILDAEQPMVEPEEPVSEPAEKKGSLELLVEANDEELTKAAVVIQATYKGFAARKKMQSAEGVGAEGGDAEGGDAEGGDVEGGGGDAEGGEAEGGDAEQPEPVEKKGSLELLVEANDEELTKAAVVIQATYKGFAARKKMQSAEGGGAEGGGAEGGDAEAGDAEGGAAEGGGAEGGDAEGGEAEGGDAEQPEPVEKKCSLELLVEANDEELTKAAVVIQATYKGFAARKKLQSVEDLDGKTPQPEQPMEEQAMVDENPPMAEEIVNENMEETVVADTTTQGEELAEIIEEIIEAPEEEKNASLQHEVTENSTDEPTFPDEPELN